MTRTFLSIGSNLGNRFEYLQTAVDRLAKSPKISKIIPSAIYETKPFGGPEQDDFLNAVLEVETELTSSELLMLAQQLESEAGRIRDIRWGPRTLDVDILSYDNVVSSDPELTLPHPRIQERAFVIIPWFEIAPEYLIPGLGKLADLFNEIEKSEVQLNREMKLEVNT